jgi:hypothetical protein
MQAPDGFSSLPDEAPDVPDFGASHIPLITAPAAPDAAFAWPDDPPAEPADLPVAGAAQTLVSGRRVVPLAQAAAESPTEPFAWPGDPPTEAPDLPVAAAAQMLLSGRPVVPPAKLTADAPTVPYAWPGDALDEAPVIGIAHGPLGLETGEPARTVAGGPAKEPFAWSGDMPELPVYAPEDSLIVPGPASQPTPEFDQALPHTLPAAAPVTRSARSAPRHRRNSPFGLLLAIFPLMLLTLLGMIFWLLFSSGYFLPH